MFIIGGLRDLASRNDKFFRFENRLIPIIYFTWRTNGAKVFSREGNSPDYLLKFSNTT